MALRPRPSFSTSLQGQAAAIRAGTTTCLELLEQSLARIDRLEPEVRAWVLVDREGARAQAVQRDAERVAGMIRGPLHGVPIGVKDIFDVAGLPTGAGARRWSDRPALRDADVVAALRSAGAVIVGKTVTTAYAWLDPAVTRNPWEPSRTPGGSSSGSAAAVATGMCAGALGTQTGGSLIRPASYCGISSLKPGYGRLSGQGIVPLAPSLDHPGIMAPRVADLTTLWQALTGALEPVRPAARPPRLGRLDGYFNQRAAPVALEALELFLEKVQQAGGTVVPVELPLHFDTIPTQFRVILAAEAAAVHAARYHTERDDYPPLMGRLIDEGNAIPATSYIYARHHQERWVKEIPASLEGLDALVMPSTPDVATDRATTGDPSFNSPWSYLGLPALTIPVAANEDGLPLGVQLLAPRYGEAALLSAALWCDERLAECGR